MARPTFRDRFYSPPVSRAITSPSGIILAGAGVAVGIVIGLPLLLAAGVGAVAYAARVAVAIPRGRSLVEINAFSLVDPWRTYVWSAKRAQRQFADAVDKVPDGPLRLRLEDMSDQVETAVDDCWRIAQSGQALAGARSQIDATQITHQLAILPKSATGAPSPAVAETASALQSQLDTANRMDSVVASTNDRLRLLNARLGELVTRVLELSVRPQDEAIGALGSDIDSIVGDMEALRIALDETDDASRAVTETPTLPAPSAALGATSVDDVDALTRQTAPPEPAPEAVTPAPPPATSPPTPPPPATP